MGRKTSAMRDAPVSPPGLGARTYTMSYVNALSDAACHATMARLHVRSKRAPNDRTGATMVIMPSRSRTSIFRAPDEELLFELHGHGPAEALKSRSAHTRGRSRAAGRT